MTDQQNRFSAEDALIARYFKPLATDPGAFDLGDDAAILKSHGDDIVVTTDAIIEGVHFLPDDPPDSIARKALRVNLSDLAAKGAEPAGFVLSIALREINDAWLAPFAAALGADAKAFGCPLLGGDTVSTPGPLMISVTAFGRVPAGKMVRRSGAAVGDRVVVTGTIGDAVVGLDILQGGSSAGALAAQGGMRELLIGRYRVPQPRLALAAAVRAYANAAMDISDGLVGDLAKLCAASGVSADIAIDAVPLSPGAALVLQQGALGLESLVSGGDDYELLCTIPDRNYGAFALAATNAGIPVTSMGSISGRGAGVRVVDAQGAEIGISRRSYSHF